MPFKCIEAEKVYEKDANLKKQDVEIIQEWLKKQPHLPSIEETQILTLLHSSYYKIEQTKIIIDNYYTIRNLCPEIFVPLTPEVMKLCSKVAMVRVLPQKTPEGYAVLMLKLLETKTENFHCANLINLVVMIATLYIHQIGIEDGAVALFDMKGFSLGHITKLNLNAIKYALYFVQECAPVRIKGIHIMNAIPLVDKVVALVKPFLNSEMYNMIRFHPPKSETLYKDVPKELLPEDYGGQAPTCQNLNETYLKTMLDNYDFFQWHDTQKVDESKRTGKSKFMNDIFGVDGTFKKLEID